MRKIKFRAKTKQGEWIVGYYVGKSSIDEVCILPFQNVNYDKNGREIYEGDILKFSNGNKLYIVKFIKGMFQASDLEGEGYSLYLLSNLDNHNYEIVGNVFDNLELLEKDK